MAHCIRHYEEPMEAYCRTCNRAFCNRCLVFSFGPNKPPYCVGCALTASGVRSSNRSPVVVADAPPAPPKADRAQRRAEKAEARANARSMKRAAKQGQDVVPEAARTTNVPVPKGLTTPSSRFAPPTTEHAVN